jgi:hypothetical protein
MSTQGEKAYRTSSYMPNYTYYTGEDNLPPLTQQEVLDITLCTKGSVGLVRDWRVSREPSGLDHRQIRYALGQIQIEKKWGCNAELTN